MIDPVALARQLVRSRSIAPTDDGALTTAQEALASIGFTCHPLLFEDPTSPPIHNLYARWGKGTRSFAFAGHTDVVPAGDESLWSVDPFAGEVRDGVLIARGAADMKGCVAAFIAAASRLVSTLDPSRATIGVILTGDEETLAINGTAKCMTWLQDRDEIPDVCLVGEPTSTDALGDTLKIGRRGTLSARLTVHGQQGHVAYPAKHDNPVNRLVRLFAQVLASPLDEGSDDFEPSHLEVTSIDVGNTATNIVPSRAVASFNIRFNDRHTVASLLEQIHHHAEKVGARIKIETISQSDSFLCSCDTFVQHLVRSIEKSTGLSPQKSTGGGTSDARFIKNYCPVAEFGLPGGSIHQIDEHARTQDIIRLAEAYETIVLDFFT
ncbi:MAG: succinyl-diaminopimelate desuccinylase [Pseudomonadota bacterium]